MTLLGEASPLGAMVWLHGRSRFVPGTSPWFPPGVTAARLGSQSWYSAASEFPPCLRLASAVQYLWQSDPIVLRGRTASRFCR